MIQGNDGNWVVEPNVVRRMVVQYWQDLFTEEQPNVRVHNFITGCFPLMSNQDLKRLTRPYAGCEVAKAIKSMEPFKAPGSDGFQPLFYQRY